jgi:ABC-type Fe3+ transport system permease subunit
MDGHGGGFMRGRRWATLLVAVTLALGGLVGIGAAPAAADPQGATLRGVYSDGQFCNSYGFEGIRTGLWTWFTCEYRPPTPASPGLYFLWTV